MSIPIPAWIEGESRAPGLAGGPRRSVAFQRKKTGPSRARPQVRQRGGASESPSRGEELRTGDRQIWEDHGQPHVAQRKSTMQRDTALHNMEAGMPAMRYRPGRPDKLRDGCNRFTCHREMRNAAKNLVAPALSIGDEKVAKCLHACDGLELFRINEIGVERDRLAVGEKLD